MPRISQGSALKGSQKWIQKFVNEKPDLLNSLIRTQLDLPSTEKIRWHSPIAEDEYAEYQDQAFLDPLDIKLLDVYLRISGLREGHGWIAWGNLDKAYYYMPLFILNPFEFQFI